MRRLAIIPARSGSRGLKDKNIIELCGKPMMAYSIEAALETGLYDRVIVTTDSDRYAGIAASFGAETMIRGADISGDTASTFQVIEDVLGRVDSVYDHFTLLQPTSPLRNAVHLAEAVSAFEERYQEYDFLVSVKEAEHAAILVKPVGDDDSMAAFDEDFKNYRRQGYREYSPNGAIFIAKPDKYLERGHFFGDRSMAYRMDKVSSADVDDRWDYLCAAAWMEAMSVG